MLVRRPAPGKPKECRKIRSIRRGVQSSGGVPLPPVTTRSAALAAFALGAAHFIGAAPIPAEDLFRSAPLGESALSPDGKHLGTIVTDEKDVKNLMIFDLKDFKAVGMRGGGGFDISSFVWLGNNRIIFNVEREKIYSWGLYAADVAHIQRFSPMDKYDVTQIVGVPRTRPGNVIVWIRADAHESGRPGDLKEFDGSSDLSLFQEGTSTDSTVHIFRAPRNHGPVITWATNREGELALCMTWLDGHTHLFHYTPATEAWDPVALPETAHWMAVDPDERFLWVVDHSAKGFELRRMEIGSGRMEPAVLIDPSYDISAGRLYFSRVGKTLAGVVYTQRRVVSVWFTQSFADAQATMDRHRPDTVNVLADHDAGERKFLFLRVGPEHPGSFELLDLDAKAINILADAAPWLKGRHFRPLQAIAFTASDGLRMEGYLTLPEGAGKDHPVPLVVLAHGGPWVRDLPEFNPEVQFLASRGYGVLQPNYRGSVGYSPEITRKQAYDYGRMSDDVADATRAILTTALIDPKRIAIMGGSFGGYLALAGVTFHPELYRCAITMAGVFDWERMIKSKSDIARPGEYEILTDEVGRPDRDHDYLDRISPLKHVEQIHVPVLIAHGTEDNIVDVVQSRKLASELKKRGIPHETFYRAVEGHGFRDYKDRVDFYHRVEAFLAANIGGASLTPK
jgi:dipeptidyl aminopeptidase/acylaminoacyl peptidase